MHICVSSGSPQTRSCMSLVCNVDDLCLVLSLLRPLTCQYPKLPYQALVVDLLWQSSLPLDQCQPLLSSRQPHMNWDFLWALNIYLPQVVPCIMCMFVFSQTIYTNTCMKVRLFTSPGKIVFVEVRNSGFHGSIKANPVELVEDVEWMMKFFCMERSSIVRHVSNIVAQFCILS